MILLITVQYSTRILRRETSDSKHLFDIFKIRSDLNLTAECMKSESAERERGRESFCLEMGL